MADKKTKDTADGFVFISCRYTYILGEHTRIEGQSEFKLKPDDQIDDQMMKVRIAREHAGGNSIRFTSFSFDYISEDEFAEIAANYTKEAEAPSFE